MLIFLVITFSLKEFFTTALDKSNVVLILTFLVTQNGYSQSP